MQTNSFVRPRWSATLSRAGFGRQISGRRTDRGVVPANFNRATQAAGLVAGRRGSLLLLAA